MRHPLILGAFASSGVVTSSSILPDTTSAGEVVLFERLVVVVLIDQVRDNHQLLMNGRQNFMRKVYMWHMDARTDVAAEQIVCFTINTITNCFTLGLANIEWSSITGWIYAYILQLPSGRMKSTFTSPFERSDAMAVQSGKILPRDRYKKIQVTTTEYQPIDSWDQRKRRDSPAEARHVATWSAHCTDVSWPI